MGIYNQAFSLFNKQIGNAKGFAMNHIFPTMKTNYMSLKTRFFPATSTDFNALRAGYQGAMRRFALREPGQGLRATFNDMKAGFGRNMYDYFRKAGVANPIDATHASLGRLKRTGLSAGIGFGGTGIGLWGLSNIGRRNQNNTPPGL